jgi:hypothetical protein
VRSPAVSRRQERRAAQTLTRSCFDSGGLSLRY